ncbi:MAG: capsule biosynthesis protein CapA [Pseudomonadota bacterium]
MARHFLFLQGPHGPFFRQLGQVLRKAGHSISRIGINAGDEAEWRGAGSYRAWYAPLSDWGAELRAYVQSEGVTDIVFYGEARPFHRDVAALGQELGICVHVFEEGYLRPYWITYERGGVNGSSELMNLALAEIRAALPPEDTPILAAPDQWGTTYRHALAGARYHFNVVLGRGRYPRFEPHRGVSVGRELRLNLRKLVLHPVTALQRRFAMRTLRATGAPYHLALLQLGHDASVQMHSPYDAIVPFMADVAEAFAAGAPPHHHLVFKTHPFDDGREPIAAEAQRLSRVHRLSGRVHVVVGGPLARLLDAAESAVTINSTAAQQALWRALPVRAMGRAIYARPSLVSQQPLEDFFAAPDGPDHGAYLDLRRFLLMTSQIKGSYYTGLGRADVLREVVDKMLMPQSPYERVLQSASRAPTARL